MGLCAAVTGCSSNPSPAPLPSRSPSASAPSEATSPEPTPPTMPAVAQGTSEKSAKAFVRYYIAALNFAGPYGETEELKRLSSRSCTACSAIIELIAEVHENGGYIRGEGWTVRSVETVTFDDAMGRVLDAFVRVHPQEIRTSASGEPSKFEGGRRLKTFWLAKRGDDWVVTRLEQPQ